MTYNVVQLQFLNYLLDSKDKDIITFNNLDDRYFPLFKNEFNFIVNHIEKFGNVPDKETFATTFTKFTFVNVTETSDFLIQQLFTNYKEALLRVNYNEVRDRINNGDIEGAINEINNFTEVSKDVGFKLKTFSLFDGKDRYDEFADKTVNYNKYYVTTGFKELDKILGGWDKKEDFVSIVARPNVGKSWILLDSAIASAKAGLRVGIYSGEMSKNKVGYRADTLIDNFSNYQLTHGNDTILNDYQKYINALPERFKGDIRILTPEDCGIDGFADMNVLRTFIRQDKLDMLFIDQLTLLEDRRHGRTQFEQMANISKDVCQLKKQEKIGIIAVTQQNRGDEDDGKNVSLIGGSDRIGQDCTGVIFLTKDKNNKNIIRMDITKVRNGEAGGHLDYVVDFDKGTFKFIPDENSQELSEDYNNIEEQFIPKVDKGGEVF